MEFLLFFWICFFYGKFYFLWSFIFHTDWFWEFSKQSFSDRMNEVWHVLLLGWKLFARLWTGFAGFFIAIWIGIRACRVRPERQATY